MKKTVLVTGTAGFIGSHLTEALLTRGDRVIGIDNFDDFYSPLIKRRNIDASSRDEDYTLIECDIRDLKTMEKSLEDEQVDIIFHGAARAGVRPSIQKPFLYEDVNIKGTLNMLELARKKSVKNFVFASSSSVYGNNKKVPFSEEDNVDRPISPYASTKKACEEMCYTFHHLYGFPVTCLRFFTVYGPRQRPEMAIHKFTDLIANNKEMSIFGDGKTSRDYTYIDDIISGIVKSLDKPFPYEIFNLGESETTHLIDLVSYIEKELNISAKIKYMPPEPGDVDITFADIKRAKEKLEYNPTTKIREGITKFVAWYKHSKKIT